MKIKEVIWHSRNDIKAVFKCENCGHEFVGYAYDDDNYWNNVMPNAICPKCKLNCKNENAEQLEKRLGRTYYI